MEAEFRRSHARSCALRPAGRARCLMLAGLLGLLLPTAGCSVPPWLGLALDILRFSAASVFVWTVLSVLISILLATGVFFLLRAVKGYRWGWRYATIFRGAVLVLMLVCFPVLLGSIGVLQGAYVAAEGVLTKPKAVTDLYAEVGSVGADLVATIYIAAPQLPRLANDLDLRSVSFDDLESFRSGGVEIDVPALADRLASAETELIAAAAARVAAEASSRVERLDSGLGHWVLTASVDKIMVPALRRAIHAEADESGVTAYGNAILDGMAQAALAKEPTSSIGRRDLSRHLVQHWIVGPLLLVPLRALIRSKQLVLWGILAAVTLVPVAFFQIADAIWRARRRSEARRA